MRKLKIAILTESVSNHSGARAPLEIAKNLAKFGHEVEIFAKKGKHDLKLIRELTKFKVKTVLLDSPKTLMSRFLPNLELLGILKKQKPDLAILAAQLPYHLSAKLSQIKTVRIYMGTQFNAYLEKNNNWEKINIFDKILNFFANRVIYMSELISTHLSSYLIAVSYYCATEVRKLYGRKVDKTIYLGGNHFDIAKIVPQARPFTLLSVSRITPYKNFHLLLNAVNLSKHKQEIVFYIVGPKINSSYLQSLKKTGPTNTKVLLNITNSQLTKLYARSHLYLTADRYLFFGFPIAESAFFQKPSIAFDFAAAREIIKNGQTGFIVKNAQEMAEKIDFLFENRLILKQLGKNAFVQANKLFDWNKISRQYQKIFYKII